MTTTFYIAATGNDGWTGTLPAANEAGTDGPFRSIPGAMLTLAEMRRRCLIEGHIRIQLRGGTYTQLHPITIDPRDASNMTFAAHEDETPVIDGGLRVERWERDQFNGVDCWSSDVTDILAQFGEFRSLFVDGRRARRARWPRQGFLEIESSSQAGPGGFFGGTRRFRLATTDPLEHLVGSDAIVLHRWIDERMPVLRTDGSTLTCARQTVMGVGRGTRVYFDNARAGFGDPGDWYCDALAGRLYYIPINDERPHQVVVPIAQQLLRILGEPEHDRFVTDLSLEGITFQHTDWSQPESWTHYSDPYSPAHTWPPRDSTRHFVKCNGIDPTLELAAVPQSAFNVPGAIAMRGVRQITFRNCRLQHLGGYAFDLQDGSRHVHLADNTLSDLGAGGIKLDGGDEASSIGRRSGGCRFQRNRVEAYGRVFASGMGIIVMFADRNVIASNTICDGFQSGISVGWRWDYEPHVTRDNLIEDNHIHNIGQGLLSDMGGIYTLGIQSGTIIRRNVIHDLQAASYGACGIYLDQASSNILVEHNRVWNVGEAISMHWGRNNTFRNNLFAYPARHGVFLGRDPHNQWVDYPPTGVRFEDNIFLLHDEIPAFVDHERAIEEAGLIIERNTYICQSGEPIVCRFAPWRGQIGPEWGYGAGDTTSRELRINDWRRLGWDKAAVILRCGDDQLGAALVAPDAAIKHSWKDFVETVEAMTRSKR